MKLQMYFRRLFRLVHFSVPACAPSFVLFIGLLILIPLGRSAAAGKIPEADPDFTVIDDYIESEMRAIRLPGLALGIVHGDQIVHLKGYGSAGNGMKVTPQTPFLIGSTGKSFTALAIMQLVEAGKVELDAPAQQYIPWFRLADPDASARITVRHLLYHSSGLPTASGLRDVEPDNRDEALEMRVRALRDTALSNPVGENFQYSNSNYEILGLIVQVVSGQSFEDYLTEHILQPLNMRHSFLSPMEARMDNASPGYRFWFGIPVRYEFPYNRALIPPGIWWSSAEDMTHYLIAHVNRGHYQDVSVLSETGIETLHRAAIRTSGSPIGSDEWYAMGWFIRKTDDLTTISHAGTTPNFHANLVMVPEGEWGIVILMNGENGLFPRKINGIARGVTTLLVGRAPWEIGPGDFLSTILIYLLAGLVIQALGMFRSLTDLRRWHNQPERRAPGALRIALGIIPSSFLNLLWAAVCLLGVPTFAGSSISTLYMFVPDFASVLLLSGGLALIWSMLRPLLHVLLLRSV